MRQPKCERVRWCKLIKLNQNKPLDPPSAFTSSHRPGEHPNIPGRNAVDGDPPNKWRHFGQTLHGVY